MMTDQIGNQASPASNSYLNNDGIDELTPMTRRKRVSSLSLSDQWAGSLQMTPTTGSTGNLKRIGSSKLSINNGLNAVRVKKTVVDHVRVASYAFAFDIDGVIVKGPETIPEAKEALKLLNGANEYNIKVPYIFVTNGGGRAEQARAEELSKRLDIEVTEDQVIQGHTPMRELVSVYNNVLVIGGVGDACRKVAEKYGFKNVFTPLDVMKWNPSVTPYHNLTEEELAVARDVDFSITGIDSILVFADSRNWAADQQIILELLLSKSGFMGTVSDSFEEGPALYFAHSDFVWATNYNLSRYGMGALQVSIAALYREHTGKELQVTRFGKPQRGTFKFASKVLSQWRKDVLEEHVEELTTEEGTSDMEEQSPGDPLLNDPSQNMNRNSKPTLLATESESESDSDNEGLTVEKLSKLTLDLPPASTVYFVGDTPESDIRFANSHDESWYSILVKTGVYQEGSIPKYKPKHICGNVLEAVKFAIEREHSKELEEWNNSAVDPDADAATTQLSPLTLVEETKVVPKKHSAKFEM